LFVGIVVDDRIWLTIPLTAHDVSSVAAVVCVDGLKNRELSFSIFC